MSISQIKNLEQLISVSKIVEQKVEPLTAPGENYGSLMLSVEVTFETRHGKRKIYAVAKMVPPNEFLQEMFNTKVTFRNEIAFYKNIIPILQHFQKENGVIDVINVAPNYLGSRLTLTGEDAVDQDAVLVLENLKMENFCTLNRKESLNKDTAKLVLKDLAILHSVSLGFKLQKPEVFEKEIKPYLTGFQMREDIFEIMKHDISNIVDQIEELQGLKDRILKGLGELSKVMEVREPFGTIIHDDCWTNNCMVKFDGATPIKSKLVDFQLCSYGSPAKDIVFFLFTSVKNEVLLEYYDDLLEHYYKVFISHLKRLHSDCSFFTFDNLLKEIDLEAKYSEFGHISYMLMPIFAEKDNVKEISEISIDTMAQVGKNISEAHKQKYAFVVQEFIKRNWL